MSDTHAINIVRDAMAVLNAHTTPTAIAQFLEGGNVKGIREDACACPIAVWINRKLWEGDCEDYSSHVTSSTVTVMYKDKDETDTSIVEEIDFNSISPLGRFLFELDTGSYSKLIS